MNILITGGSGFVGRNLVRFFSRQHHVSFTYLRSRRESDLCSMAAPVQMDVCQETAARECIEKIAPEAVIHIAGNKNVRHCEMNPRDAHAVNATGVQNVARACRLAGARMVYLSTDLVFDCKSGGYLETDRPLPSSVYGRTKYEGEQLALAEIPDVAICRSGGIYGPESPLLSWAGNELSSGREITCLTNVVNTPTYVDNLAEMIDVILNRRLSGTFHAVGSSSVNRYEFFREFARTFNLDATLLRPVASDDLMRELFLVPNASLGSAWTNDMLGVESMSLEQGMRELKSKGPL
jgi:dTDP-4-dehydrorhamnose reductase